jgi:hypothetical protein
MDSGGDKMTARLATAVVVLLAFSVSAGAEPSPWQKFRTQEGVTVSWRWELREGGVYRGELQFVNTTEQPLKVSYRPWFETAEGHNWTEGGQVISLEPRQTKAGEGVAMFNLPGQFKAAPRSGGFQSMAVRVMAESVPPTKWFIDQETEALRVEWSPVREHKRYIAAIRLTNLLNKPQILTFQAQFTNPKGQVWKAPQQTLTVPERSTLEGEEYDLVYQPVYHTIDPLSSHDLWLAPESPPRLGGIRILSPKNTD